MATDGQTDYCSSSAENLMVARLGNVLFWWGVIIAVVWLVMYFLFGGGIRNVGDALNAFAIPAICIAVGWGLRYILSGRQGN
jgi:dolichyl-phosphate-mannose--protein O-mannosyl transferase